jgi:hypothetical protein
MQALKALVIFLAVLIVAGMALLVYGLMTRTGGDDGGQVAAGAPAAGAMGAPRTPAVDFGTLDLAIPDGCSLAGSELSGDRLVVHVNGQAGRGCQQIIIFDLVSGRELGRVKAVPSSMQAAP